jgi:hypothetical protein
MVLFTMFYHVDIETLKNAIPDYKRWPGNQRETIEPFW